MALRLTGQGRAAAVQIGRTPQAVYARRKRDADFRRRWDDTLAAQQAECIEAQQARLTMAGNALEDCGGGPPAPWRDVADGFGPVKRALFLRVLRRTKRVGEACAAAGVSSSTVYALRSRSVRFAAAWDEAVRAAPPPSVLEAARARAVEGWDEPIVRGGQVVAYRRRYSDGLLRDLLRAEQARGGAAKGVAVKPQEAPPQAGRVTEAELNDVLLRKLALLDGRRREAERLKAEREWERWRLGWVDHALAAPTAEDLRDEDEDDEDWDGED